VKGNDVKVPRPVLQASSLAILCAVFIALADNRLFWSSLFRVVDPLTPSGLVFTLTAFLALAGMLIVFFLLFSARYLFRPVLMLSLLLASVIGYFGSAYGVIVEGSIVQSFFATDVREAGELMTWRFAVEIMVFGVLPALAVGFVRVSSRGPMRELRQRSIAIGLTICLMLFASLTVYKDLVLIGREHKELRMTMNPLYAVYSAVKYAKKRGLPGAAIATVGGDARRGAVHPGKKRDVVVLVVGETARAREFSLNGYERKTNPLLEYDGVVSFTRAFACGTSTADSLPCMFSFYNRSEYSVSKAANHENVLDVLSRAGVRVLWRDNNAGCKGVCLRVEEEDLSHAQETGYCNGEECFDEVLLDRLEERIEETDGDILIVLHQKGSHGPAYYKRHPSRFSVFAPECSSYSPQNCATNEIVNAYDNTILYTDYLLHRTIGILRKRFASDNTMLLYLSDHGESLGENGIYLHGLPYMVAPDEQTHVPFIAWLSDGYTREHGVDRKCLDSHHDRPYSHANLFHSLLGSFDVQTEVYRPERDILAECRTGPRVL
jgi:lipid A ethanolaminephosphotransferase